MSQEYKEKTKKQNGQMIKISLVSLLIMLLFVIEMYEIINDPANMIVIGTLGVFLLVSVYVEMLFIGKLIEKRAKDQEEAFDNVYRSEKASYLLIRKCFDQMENKMDNLGDLSNLPYKELIAAQKALAKAQINRNKQNTNALLISNDRMMQRLTSMQSDLTDILANTANTNNQSEDTIQQFNPGLSEQDREIFLDGNRDVLQKQQEILHNIKELESSLRNEIIESANKVASIQSQQSPVSKLQMDEAPQMELGGIDDIAPLDIETDNSEIQPQMELGGLNDFPSLDIETENTEIQPQMELGGLGDIAPLDVEVENTEMQPQMELGGLDDIAPLDVEENNTEMQPQMELGGLDDIAPLDVEVENTGIQPQMELGGLDDIAPLDVEENNTEIQPQMELGSLDDFPSLDIETENAEIQPQMELGSFDDIVPQKSSESNLDKLLQQINAPKSVQTEIPSLKNEYEQQTITDDIDLQLNIQDSDLQSLNELQPIEESTAEPVISESELQPVVEDSTAESVISEPELQPAESIEPEQILGSASNSEALAKQPTEFVSESNEITPDKLAAMVANLGNDMKIEPELELAADAGEGSFMAETLEPAVQKNIQQSSERTSVDSTDDDLEKIMKEMNIDNIPDNSLEDLDIDKILEFPLGNEKSDSNQVMSSDEIAALIANTELLSEPEPTKNDDLMDLSDPSHVMSSDEIAALIANM